MFHVKHGTAYTCSNNAISNSDYQQEKTMSDLLKPTTEAQPNTSKMTPSQRNRWNFHRVDNWLKRMIYKERRELAEKEYFSYQVSEPHALPLLIVGTEEARKWLSARKNKARNVDVEWMNPEDEKNFEDVDDNGNPVEGDLEDEFAPPETDAK